MKLDCQMCGKTTVLTDGERERIVSKLKSQGPAATHIWNCACGRFQIALRLRAPIRQRVEVSS
jgi:hypothetical protein